VRNVFEEEEEVEKEEEDSNALSWVLCAAANKDEGQEGGTKEKRKNVHKTNSRGRSTMLFNCKICLLELFAKARSLKEAWQCPRNLCTSHLFVILLRGRYEWQNIQCKHSFDLPFVVFSILFQLTFPFFHVVCCFVLSFFLCGKKF
jgi:hypothetical protein